MAGWFQLLYQEIVDVLARPLAGSNDEALLTASNFAVYKDRLRQKTCNRLLDPRKLNTHLRKYLRQVNIHLVEDCMKALECLTMNDMMLFVPAFFSRLYVKAFVYGNVSSTGFPMGVLLKGGEGVGVMGGYECEKGEAVVEGLSGEEEEAMGGGGGGGGGGGEVEGDGRRVLRHDVGDVIGSGGCGVSGASCEGKWAEWRHMRGWMVGWVMMREEAKEFVDYTLSTLKPREVAVLKPYPKAALPACLNRLRVMNFNKTDVNTSLVLVSPLQGTPSNDLRYEVMNELLESCLQESAFAYLRTRETLGYAVGLYSWSLPSTTGQCGLSVGVSSQANKFDSNLVAGRMYAFWYRIVPYIVLHLNEEAFQTSVEALIAANLLEDATMKVEINRNKKEVFSDRPMFDRRQKSVEILRQLKLSELQKFYRETYYNFEKQPALMIQVDALEDVSSEVSPKGESLKSLKTFDWPLCVVPMNKSQAEAEQKAALEVDVREAVRVCAPSLVTDAAKGDHIIGEKGVHVTLPRIVEIAEIIIMAKFQPFDSVDMSTLISEAELDFQFENESILACYRKLMACVCSKCGFTAPNMSALNRHTTNEHRLSFCDLCLRHAHMLPSEFVPLSCKDLVAHRKWDKVKKRGHPVCEFCAQTFYEFENLIIHIREAHFICDFCHTIGVFEVFRRQQELFSHYKRVHFVCPECESAGRMACFASEEQLGIHRIREHPNESKNDPSLWEPLQILYSNQGLIGQHTRGRNGGRRGQNAATEGGEADGLVVFYPAQPRAPMPEEWTVTDFPSLTGERAANDQNGTDNEARSEAQRTAAAGGRQMRSHAEVASGLSGSSSVNSHNLKDFPALPSSSSGNASENQPTSQPKWLRPKTDSSATIVPKPDGPRLTQKSAPKEDDFPSLIGSSTATNHIVPTNWGAAPNKVTPKPKESKRLPTGDDFPALVSTASASSTTTSHRILPEPRLPSYVLPPSKQTEKAKDRKTKSRVVEPSLPPAPDLEPFSSALLKAKKSSWWNSADNDGAVSRMAKEENGEGGRMAAPTYSRIQTVDHFESAETATPSAPPPPPEFSSKDFPSLGGGVNSSKKNVSTKSTATKKPQEVKEGKKSAAATQLPQKPSPKPRKDDTDAGHVQAPSQIQTPSEEPKILPFLEDTETVLYEKNVYTPPLDYEAKNREVITAAETVLSGEGYPKNAFTRFASLSRLFRHGQLSAHSYLEALESLLTCKGGLSQTDWLSSMIALLPDVGLQRALLRALKGEAAPRVPRVSTPARCRGTQTPVWAKSVVATLQVCSVCGQVCQRSGMREHTELAHS
ncbi:unnamed protein product [Hydatigera taeniaeformis]|uniref:C2H2-type domain-containing protein n=1 Tax=Hydatigena taeniaeformis TaxID=6205 RepID=A0A0R3X3Q8_HYDTA|nr:unnamed protein product [Hydatigera taeniaeformis]